MMLCTQQHYGSRPAAGRCSIRSARPSAWASPITKPHRPHSPAAPGAPVRTVVARISGYPYRIDSLEADNAYLQSSVASYNPGVRQVDFAVIGSGIAGLSYALKVAEYGSVAIITKDAASEGSTRYAQGGVCAVLDATDSVADHVRDTIVAGAFLNKEQAVEVVCREGPARVLELVRMGAEFTHNKDGSLHLTMEGGHSNRRIVHAADATGAEIERALLARARAHPRILFYEHHLAVDLVMDEHAGAMLCFGVDVLDQQDMKMIRFIALATMLASGGAGQVYPNTTNPHVATGDGIAMAHRAQATISNMEFVQFHPTALYNPLNRGRVALISEALRGEGAQLFNLKGERFMSRYDERLELAPRDVVARSIHDQMRMHGSPHVWLDISHKPRKEILHHFPNIAASCAAVGVDITRDPIPVLPAQHYTCGGVTTGLQAETSVSGLFACGEVADSGLHGANRLASNSLLEGLVFAERAVNPSVAHAEHALRSCGRQLHYAAASADFRGARAARELAPQLETWVADKAAVLREVMWRNCGIVRRTQEILDAQDAAVSTYVEAAAVMKSYGVSTPLVELLNLSTVAELITACALQRQESRGLHFSADYPHLRDDQRKPSCVNAPLVSRHSMARATVPQGPYSSLAAGKVLGGTKMSSARVAVSKPALTRDLVMRSSAQDM